MRILYGVCGEGYGHAFRALAVAEHLEKKGHELLILTYGKAYEILKEKFKVVRIEGLNYVVQDSKINKRRTVIHNVKNFPKNLIKHGEFKKIMNNFRPDVCLTDFEPVSAYLAKIHRIPLVSIDNEHVITSSKLKIPKGYRAYYLLAKNIVRAMTGRAKYFVVVSFFDFIPKKKNVFVVHPVLRPDILGKKIEDKEKIVVYLSREDDSILELLRKINERFVVFGYNVDKIDGNLEFKTREKFLDELVKCKAVIATAGFTLISEAIYLKKPLLALPIKGQFEQFLNALFLKNSVFGEYSKNLTKKEIENFLHNLGRYREALNAYNPDYNVIFRALDEILIKLDGRHKGFHFYF